MLLCVVVVVVVVVVFDADVHNVYDKMLQQHGGQQADTYHEPAPA